MMKLHQNIIIGVDTMKVRKLGNSSLEVSSIGLGLMGMSPGIYGQTNDEESVKTILALWS